MNVAHNAIRIKELKDVEIRQRCSTYLFECTEIISSFCGIFTVAALRYSRERGGDFDTCHEVVDDSVKGLEIRDQMRPTIRFRIHHS